MTEWNDAVKSRLMAYCRIDALEDGEDLLLQGLYDAAVSYMEQAGISEPKEETPSTTCVSAPWCWTATTGGGLRRMAASATILRSAGCSRSSS